MKMLWDAHVKGLTDFQVEKELEDLVEQGRFSQQEWGIGRIARDEVLYDRADCKSLGIDYNNPREDDYRRALLYVMLSLEK